MATMAETSRDRVLAPAMRAGLAPPRFPVRRDVELAAALGAETGSGTPFYDHLWLSRQELAVIVARVPGSGVAALQAAAGLRQLLRAALLETDDPAAALGLAGPWLGGSDVALAILDTASGRLRGAVHGAAFADEGELAPGGLGFAGVGRFERPAEGVAVPVDGPGGLLPAGLQPGAAVAALLFKLPATRPRGLTLTVANDTAAVAEAVQRLDGFWQSVGIAEDRAMGLSVALDEVLTNAVSYAFEGGVAHEIVVDIVLEDGRLCVEVRDDGLPFDPLSVPPPDLDADIEARSIGGLGMHFVRTLLDRASYARERGWNVLRLEKSLADREEEATS